MEYIIYCDESSSNGPKYSDFFGGCIVCSQDINTITERLNAKKQELHLHGEIKWTKVTAQYLDRYVQMMDLFFDYVRDGKIKVRIMFRDNKDLPSSANLSHNNDDKYFKLYYQFLKHAFGLMHLPESIGETYIRIYLDQLPDTREKCEAFKDYIRKFPQTRDFENVSHRLHIRKEDVTDVCSHDHVLLQCTDIVLGAMFFRLNGFHLEKPEGSRTRGKRTIAKEKLYQHINQRIREILPNFNIGVSTGSRGYGDKSWELPYSHWKFVPK